MNSSQKGTHKYDARDMEVKRLLDVGLVPAQVAAQLGITKNMVHGIVYRRGWAGRREKVVVPPAAAAPQEPPSPVTAVPNYKRGSTNGLALTRRKRAAEKRTAAESPFADVPPATPQQLHQQTPFHLLRASQCRFIPGEPAWDAPACGLGTLGPGVHWCAEHAGLCYAGVPPARRG